MRQIEPRSEVLHCASAMLELRRRHQSVTSTLSQILFFHRFAQLDWRRRAFAQLQVEHFDHH